MEKQYQQLLRTVAGRLAWQTKSGGLVRSYTLKTAKGGQVRSYTSKVSDVSEVSRVSEVSKMLKQGEQQSLHSLRPLPARVPSVRKSAIAFLLNKTDLQ